MFTVTDVMMISNFMESIRKKGVLVVLEIENDVPRLRIEYKKDEIEMMNKLVEDWVLFHSQLVRDFEFYESLDCLDCVFELPKNSKIQPDCSSCNRCNFWAVIRLKERFL